MIWPKAHREDIKMQTKQNKRVNDWVGSSSEDDEDDSLNVDEASYSESFSSSSGEDSLNVDEASYSEGSSSEDDEEDSLNVLGDNSMSWEDDDEE